MLTINVNGLTLCHKGSGGVSHNTLPNVCNTSPDGAPVPFENEAYSADLIKGTTSVSADGGNMIATMGSQFARSVFDEPGNMGGVRSGTNGAEAEWLSHSFDVFFEKKPACRLTDKMFMNHRNTVNMAGLMQMYLPPVPEMDDDMFDKTSAPDRLEKKAPTPEKSEDSRLDDATPQEEPESKEYLPLIVVQDAPGVNGLPYVAREWHVVIADTVLQALSTDEVVMTGTSDNAGKLFTTEDQSRELMRLYQQMPSSLWVVEGNRAHNIAIYLTGNGRSRFTLDGYAEDTMGYHREFDVTIKTRPGEALWERVRRESKVTDEGSLLDLLKEEKSS